MVRRIRARKATVFLGTAIILWQLFIGAAFANAGGSPPTDWITRFFQTINEHWGYSFWDGHPLKFSYLVVMFGGGIFFTIGGIFVNVRLFRHAFDVVAGKFDRPEDKG